MPGHLDREPAAGLLARGVLQGVAAATVMTSSRAAHFGSNDDSHRRNRHSRVCARGAVTGPNSGPSPVAAI